MIGKRQHSNERFASFTDEELIDRYRETEETAYLEELFRRYLHLCFLNCYHYLENIEDSKDMTMNVFATILKQLPSLDRLSSFKNWLFIVTKNECLNVLRAKKNKYILPLDVAAKEPIFPTFPEGDSNQGGAVPTKEALVWAVDQLPREQSICVQLFFFEKKSYREIAAHQGFSLKQVKSFLQNGKRNLRKILSTSRILNK